MESEQVKKQLQGLMSDERWGAFEAFVADFMTKHFVQNSIKRATEHDTIWYAAETEGGKRYIQLLLQELEKAANEARS